MSYAAAAALQEAIYNKLLSDTGVQALVGTAIFDALPAGPLPQTYVTLGPETVRDRSDKSAGGAWHNTIVSVVTESAGFQTAKDVAAAINDALIDAPLSLSRGTLACLNFYRATAKREGTGSLRRIDLTFRARIDF